jgi:putative ABC transport system permease protein
MVALPVALSTAAATVARTIVGSPEEEVSATMGTADVLLSVGRGLDPGRLRSRLPSGSEVVTLRGEEVGLVRQGELIYAGVVEADPGLESPVLRGMYELSTGRAPGSAGEAAVNQRLLDVFEAQVGDEIEVGDHRLRVTGTAIARELNSPLAIVGRGTFDPRSGFVTALIDLPDGVQVAPSVAGLKHQGFDTRDEVAGFASRDATTWEAVSLVGGILALFCTGLIAAAAFVVGTRRQLRELGLVGAVGGERRHVRTVVWLGGTTLGLVGGVLGSAIGIGIAFALHPLVPRFLGRMSPIDVNPVVVLAVILMATVAATLAALLPARAAGKLSVMEALSGRMPPPRRPGRVAGLGVLILVGGGAVTAWGTVEQKDVILAVGTVLMLSGVLFAIPLLVSTMGRFTNFLPAAGRLAARDAARHGRKTGAAVAAGVIALAVPVAVSAYSLSEETYKRRSPRLYDNELLIGTFSEVEADTSPPDVAAAFTRALPGASVVPLTQAVSSHNANIQDGSIYVDVRAPGALGGVSSSAAATIVGWPLFVGEATMLHAIGAEEGSQALAEGRAVVLGGYDTRNGFVRISGLRKAGRPHKVAATAIDSPGYLNESIPKVVVSPDTAARLGLKTQVSNHLLSNASPLSSDDIARARETAERHPGVFVNSNDDYLPRYAAARTAATAASLLLGLAVLAVAVALVVSESRRSHQILAAIGAGPFAHRKIVASTAALLAGITALLAIPAGFLPTAIVQVSSQTGRPVVVPWITIGIVVLVTPIAAGVAAGLVSKSPRMGSLLSPST